MTDWSKRTVSDKLDVKGKSIDRLVSWYFKNEIWVNRRYQRKLVWTKKDKQSFIDSIIKRFPTPSIMLCSYDIIGTDMHRYEIIDGLQRIDAIISFITNKFAVSYNGKECYFDLEILSTTNRALADNRLIQGTPVLPENVCDRILDYELPIILTEQDQEKVEEIFIRINSKGRRLSVHDLRQSSSCDSLANLVRRISCHLRGEFSFDDLMALSDMPKISLSSPDLDYGVDSSNAFWMRHGILSYDRIKQSRDEEIVAQIIGELFIPNCSNPDGNILNKMYKAGERYNTLLNDKIDEIGINEIFDNVCHTFDVIEDIFRSVDSNFSSWLFSKPNKTSECFRIFFIAVHKILGEGY
ncbi:MAG: DUF262 domain-containing protein, partial [Clostridiales bacterium]|nr:DUF262 domain-containing protein [Clostridiales bacterium]